MLSCDGTGSDLVSTCFAYRAVTCVAMKGLAVEPAVNAKSPRGALEGMQESLRASLVAAMTHGNALVVDVTNTSPDFAGRRPFAYGYCTAELASSHKFTARLGRMGRHLWRRLPGSARARP